MARSYVYKPSAMPTHKPSSATPSPHQTPPSIVYQVYHLTSVRYSLGTTYINQKELHKIQGRAVSTFLATSGYNRHMKRELVFAPREHGGIGMVALLLLQGQQGIKLLHRHLLHQTEIGQQLRIDIAWIQQEAGTHLPTYTSRWVLGILVYDSGLNLWRPKSNSLESVDHSKHTEQPTPTSWISFEPMAPMSQIFANSTVAACTSKSVAYQTSPT
jgi:hypothetical protein